MSTVANRLRAEWSETYAEWMVILMVVVALAAGWGVKSYAENQAARYTAGGVSVSYPFGWSASTTADGVLRFRDMRAGGAPSMLEVRSISMAGASSITQTLALEADALALSRAQDLTAYRILETDDAAAFRGQPALRVSYVFVLDEPDAFQQHLPAVMLGEDVLTYQQERVVVFSVQATKDEFDQMQHRFRALLESARFD
jgi:hypothetical protein